MIRHVPQDLIQKRSSGVNYARWLSTACKIQDTEIVCFDFSSICETSTNLPLNHICVGAMLVHNQEALETWKWREKFLKIVTLSHDYFLSSKLKVVLLVLQRNAYAAHSESVLLSLLANDKTEVWEEALNIITEIRAADSNGDDRNGIRLLQTSNCSLYIQQWEQSGTSRKEARQSLNLTSSGTFLWAS